MNEKGWYSALGGLSAIVRTVAATDRKLYERLSCICLRPFFPLFLFAFLLARISGGAVSKLFLCLAVKDRPVAQCAYMCAYVSGISGVGREGASCPDLNYAISYESLAEMRWIVTYGYDSPHFARRDTIFFVGPTSKTLSMTRGVCANAAE